MKTFIYLLLSFLFSGTSFATSSFNSALNTAYPGANVVGCNNCHTNGGGTPLNSYGGRFKAQRDNGFSTEQTLTTIGPPAGATTTSTAANTTTTTTTKRPTTTTTVKPTTTTTTQRVTTTTTTRPTTTTTASTTTTTLAKKYKCRCHYYKVENEDNKGSKK